MAIDRPEAIDGAPRRGLTAKEGLSWLARNDGAAGRGRKSIGAIAAQAIEAQPTFGQISPLKRPFGAVDLTETHHRRTWRPSRTDKTVTTPDTAVQTSSARRYVPPTPARRTRDRLLPALAPSVRCHGIARNTVTGGMARQLGSPAIRSTRLQTTLPTGSATRKTSTRRPAAAGNDVRRARRSARLARARPSLSRGSAPWRQRRLPR